MWVRKGHKKCTMESEIWISGIPPKIELLEVIRHGIDRKHFHRKRYFTQGLLGISDTVLAEETN